MVDMVFLHVSHQNENWILFGIYFKNQVDEQIIVLVTSHGTYSLKRFFKKWDITYI